jgi:hypothetical protein
LVQPLWSIYLKIAVIDSNEDGENSVNKLKMIYQGYKIDTNKAKAVFEP